MITVDFETFSPENLTKTGSYKYMMHPSADIVCMAYKIDDGETLLWRPGAKYPERLMDKVIGGDKVHGHNVLFEYLAWNTIGVRKYSWPELLLGQLVDTQALCNRYTLPGSLEKAGAILELKIQKQKQGKALMRKISFPTAAGKRPKLGADFTNNDLLAYYDYCCDDVNTTYEMVKALPADELSGQEQGYWELTQEMNLRGLPIDEVAIPRIRDYVKSYVVEMTLRVPELSGGAFQKVTQVAKMKDWVNDQGIKVDNLQATTVDELLERDDLPEAVREMLILRQAIGQSSVAKFKKLTEMMYHGVVYNNLQYYGTVTGRLAGRGFQMHNLPRASVPNPEELIDDFCNFRPVKDPVNVAKALIRPMIKALIGQKLIVSDYSSIENRILMWLAGEQKVLDSIVAGEDQYVVMAGRMYNIEYTELIRAVRDKHKVAEFQRQVGKVIVLGAGFQMGHKRFKESAKGFGLDLPTTTCELAITTFRKEHKQVVKLWKQYSTCVIAAIRNPGKAYQYGKVLFKVVKDRNGRVWLRFLLPSGRSLYYKDPFLEDTQYGPAPGHMGINPYSKKWSRMRLIPGRITENVVQALARDIMMTGCTNVNERMDEVRLIGSVHDEALGMIRDDDIYDYTQERFDNLLCDMPGWADGLPLKAEGFIAERYRK